MKINKFWNFFENLRDNEYCKHIDVLLCLKSIIIETFFIDKLKLKLLKLMFAKCKRYCQ